jgi:hypothetical protein
MNPITKDNDMSTTHALIRTEAGGKNMAIEAVGNEPSVMAFHAVKIDGDTGGVFWSVREIDHDMTRTAAAAMADRLTPNQRTALADLERDRRKYVRAAVRPGLTPSWRGMDSLKLATVTKSTKLAPYVHVVGVPYGPKTYRLTSIGRIVAAAVIDAASIPA